MKNNIIALDVSKEYILYIDKFLEISKLIIIEWFEKSYQEFKVNTFIYKDNISLREGLKRRGLGLYPSYMIACMVDEDLEKNIRRSINFYEPKTLKEKKEYNQVVFHELIHYITDMIYGKLPEWLTEGIAKYLDGSYKENIENLINDQIKNYEIPSIKEMKGDFFVLTKFEEISSNEKKEITIYNGYDISYLMIRYIIETQGKTYLFELMNNKGLIEEQEEQILSSALDYFYRKYSKENTIKL